MNALGSRSLLCLAALCAGCGGEHAPVWTSLSPPDGARLARPGLSAVGQVLTPDQPLELGRADLRVARALTLTVLGAPEDASISLRIDGEDAATRAVPADHGHVRFDLPMAGEGAALALVLEAVSVDADVLVVDPIVGPAEVGAAGNRPWDAPPDVHLLMADTFRADNLGLHVGSTPSTKPLTPALDAFAETAVRFDNARAAATWTLPSHASLFTALTPPEIGIADGLSRLGPEHVTLAERFRAAGYRTVAITDAGFVAAAFGLDQGFAHYEETGTIEEPRFERTLAAVERALDRDDGRPLLLFVQSYRAHVWTVGPETRERLGDALAFRPDDVFRSRRWKDAVLQLLGSAEHGAPMAGADYEAEVASMVANYRGASADAAAGFGRILEALEERGGAASAVTVFTSDHGEALGSHGVVSHGNGVWDGQSLVPLVVRAPGRAAGSRNDVASLLDLPRTLCALARVEPHPRWRGVDLFATGIDGSRLHAVHQTLPARVRYVAAIEWPWKLVFRDADGPQELVFAYDLGGDPAEARNLAGELEGTERERRARAFLQDLQSSRDSGQMAQPPEAVRRQLEAMGYGGR
ncbi:MAG: sulfatase [Planctomycetota bacterium]|nr:sulfatase [Planctomycetota bacterium]